MVTEHSRTRVSPMLTDKSLGPWMVVSTRPEMKIFLLHESFLEVICQYFDSYSPITSWMEGLVDLRDD